MTKKRVVRGAIVTLVTIIAFALCLEAFLWFVDPLGIATFVYDLANIETIPNAEGYTLAPGVHYGRHWSYTIDADGNRVMPTSNGSCTIRFVGDSVAFGMDVNDEQSFTYNIALDHPDIHFINAAKISYNAGNIWYSVEHSAADGYFYFMSDNDEGSSWTRPPTDYGKPRDPLPRLSALRYYLEVFRAFDVPPNDDWDMLWKAVTALEARDDILIIAMKSPLSDEVAKRYPDILTVDRWSTQQQVSWVDGHPNVAGHEYLYNQLHETVGSFVESRCATVAKGTS